MQNFKHSSSLKRPFKLEREKSTFLRKMSAELIDTAEETIIDYLMCPCCNDYIHPPSFCCENGHFVCEGCHKRIPKCPSCDTENYPNKKNIIFDNILTEIYYPCSYQGNGCSAFFKHSELKEHELACSFKLEPCSFQYAGCSLFFETKERIIHENECEYGVFCRIYAKIKGIVYTQCSWKGTKEDLPFHITKSHNKTWYPPKLESGVALCWMLPMTIDFEKVELIRLKDDDEMFYFYSKSIANLKHFVALQYVGHKGNCKDYMYSVDFVYEDKKVGFEDLVIPYNVHVDDIYKSSNCFSIEYEFLKNHFMAERVIDCYVKVFKKEQKKTAFKKYLTYLDNLIKEE